MNTRFLSRLRSPPLHEHRPHISRMSRPDDSTPQSKIAKQWVESYASLDMKNVAAITSKNYQYEALPEIISIPKETKEKHIERYREIVGAMTKAEVRIQHGESPQTDIRLPPLGNLSRSD